jgi:hypothetical protein
MLQGFRKKYQARLVAGPDISDGRTGARSLWYTKSAAAGFAAAMVLGGLSEFPVRIDDEFACDAGVE